MKGKDAAKYSTLIQGIAIGQTQAHLIGLEYEGIKLRYPIEYFSSLGLKVIAKKSKKIEVPKTEFIFNKLPKNIPNKISRNYSIDDEGNLIDNMNNKIIVPFENIKQSDLSLKKFIKNIFKKK